MRKSLVVLLAFAMVFTMFNAVVFAADEPSSLDRLKTAGVIEGTPSGDTMDDQPLLRQDAAVLVSRMHDAEAEAKATEKSHSYADVTDGKFYDGYLSWALENGLMHGHSDTNFGYNEPINNQQFLTVLLRAIGIDDYDNAIERAVEEGITPEELDADGEVIRSDVYEYIVNTLDYVLEDGFTLGHKLGLEGWVVEAPEISAKAVDVDEIEVTFSKAVDPELEVELKSGLIPYATENTWNDANTKVSLKSQFPLPGAEYTVSVEGYDDLTVEIEDEKAVSLTIDSLGLENVNDAKLAFTLLNQYGKAMDLDTVSNVTVTAFNVTRGLPISVTGFELDIKAVSQINDQIVVTVVHNDLTETKTVPVIAETAAASFVFTNVVPTDEDATRLYKDEPAEIKYTLTNQYGQVIKLPASAPNNTIGGVTFISSDPSIVDVAKFATNADGKLTFTPEAGKTGKVKITSLVAATGQTHSIEIQIVEKNALKTFKISPPAELVAVGEKVNLPFTALDEFGAQLAGKDISGADRLKLNIQAVGSGAANVSWVDNKLELEATGQGSVSIYVHFNGEHQNTITVNIRAAAEAKRVTGTKDLAAIFEKDGTFKLEYKHLVVVDQYNRPIAKDDFADDIKVELASDDVIDIDSSSDGGATTKVAEIDKNGHVTFKGLKDEGSVKVTFSIKDVAGSAFSTNLSAIKSADIKSFELDAIGLLYATGGQEADVKITGKTEGGALVNLSPNKITLLTTTDDTIVDVDSDNLKVKAQAGDGGKATITAWSGATQLASIEVETSKAAPVPAKVSIKDPEAVLDDIADIDALLKIEDQYGNDITGVGTHKADGTWTSSDTSVVSIQLDGTLGAILKDGTTTIGFVSKNGVVATQEIEVEL